jgi:hypothetical protein
MSMVLRFKPQVRSGAVKASLRERHCEIVIFPGVRIERHAEPDVDRDDAVFDAVAFEADVPVPRRG